MATGAVLRERGRRVGRIGRLLIVRQVTASARGRAIHVGHLPWPSRRMTRAAIDGDVKPGEGKRRRLMCTTHRRHVEKAARRMTRAAARAELSMMAILMTGRAGRRYAGEIQPLVAGRAGRLRAGSGQARARSSTRS